MGMLDYANPTKLSKWHQMSPYNRPLELTKHDPRCPLTSDVEVTRGTSMFSLLLHHLLPPDFGPRSLVLLQLIVWPLECITRLLFTYLSRVFSQLNTSCLLSSQILHRPHATFLDVPDCMLSHCAWVLLGSLSTPGLCHLHAHFTCFLAHNRVARCRCWDRCLQMPHRCKGISRVVLSKF